MWFIYRSWNNITSIHRTQINFEQELIYAQEYLKDFNDRYILSGKADTKHTYVPPSAGHIKEEPI